MSDPSSEIFRQEALDHLAAGQGREGRVLRIHPAWIGYVWWLLLAVVAAAVVLAIVVNINQYATGPAIVRSEGRSVVTAIAAGTIVGVDVRPGQLVSVGDVLLRLDDAQPRAELERIERDIESQTRKVLIDLSDQEARRSLMSLRALHDLAEAELEQRTVRAPQGGVVSDIRIRAGQRLNAGDIVLALLSPERGFTAIALLPGHYRPMLKPGQPLRLELSGYRYAYQRLTIDSIGDEVVGPEEARRFLGHDVADAVRMSGPVVLVRASIPAGTFTADRRTYNYFDGMPAMAEARVGRENVLIALVPGLKGVLEGWRE